ncbi:hypothetical protein CCACVL1_10047 [Corchorus capsularis]|uniref:Uncharacterized protein n=1 Tax=Corchorus capsularis TaxID=210143 RepID=A0A1R3ISZ4_COCAP|nr:hypothetical protein CCACVL1_10047 [Corchorus capsularis]
MSDQIIPAATSGSNSSGVSASQPPPHDDIVLAPLRTRFEHSLSFKESNYAEDDSCVYMTCKCPQCGNPDYIIRYKGDWKEELPYKCPKPPNRILEPKEVSDLPFASVVPAPNSNLEREYTFLYCYLCETTHSVVRFKGGFHDHCGIFLYGKPRFQGEAKDKGLKYLFSCPCGGELSYTSPPPPKKRDYLKPKHGNMKRIQQQVKHRKARQIARKIARTRTRLQSRYEIAREGESS